MRILYLTPAWFGFDKMVYEGGLEITGLPSFCYPLKMLVEQGHSIDMVIIYTNDERDINVKSQWVGKINIISQFKYHLSLPKKIMSIFGFRRLVRNLVTSKNYDFVYVHGSSPSVANDIVRNAHIPLGQRLYGTFLWDKIKKVGLKQVRFKHVVEYLSFRTSKNFLLATDDGSGADNVVKTIFEGDEPPYNFLYWKNGVSRVDITEIYEEEFFHHKKPQSPFIFYCARFDAWKRQDRVINIIKQLKDVSIDVKVVFAGPFDTLGDDYYKKVIKMATDLGVLEQCIFLGSISKQDIYLYNKYAVASLSLYDVCNVTSVFHEMMASGALIIVRNDSDVNAYISQGETGFLIDTDEECVSLLSSIIKESNYYQDIRENAMNLSNEMTLDWTERSQKEISLIQDCVGKIQE